MESLIGQDQMLQTQINDLWGAYQGMEDRIQNLESEVSTLYEENSSLRERITVLEGSLANHNHSYLTGKGKAHNYIQATTGPAVFP